MECKFAIKYGDKRSYLAKVYPRLTSSVQNPEVVEFTNLSSNQIWVVQRLPVFCPNEVRRGYIFAKYDRLSPYFIANLHSMMDLCFYISLYMSIPDGYGDFNRRKYIKSEKSPIVYGDVYESRAFASILPYFKE